ncbi:MAG: DUF2220 family protein [Peptostreptococcaceae bacterium]|nr:DUF2220 family protein [Peptostreptococcaceae bacterium]
MKKWTDFHDIKAKLEKKWTSGEILRNIIEEKGLFPDKIKITGPNSNELSLEFEKAIQWIKKLKDKEKSKLGYGYSLEEKEINFRIVGRNPIPVYAVIETTEDALKLLNKNAEAKLFQNICREFFEQWRTHPNFERLKEWLLKYPFRVIEQIGANCPQIILVLKWFEQNPEHFVYIRQLDIEGVDTKFIEKHQSILGELMEILLPDTDFDLSQKKFEDKFRLRKKPAMVRFRILDEHYSSQLFRDITVPLEEFQSWENTIEKVFFTENEINFLSFSNLRNSIVIFGKGYGIYLLRDVQWLKNKEVYYWGDIDTHGFNILSIARGFLPNIRSFLMTEQILTAHKNLWVDEDSPFLSEIKNLTPQEQDLLYKLQHDYFGTKVRLEQERIRFKYLKEWMEQIDFET